MADVTYEPVKRALNRIKELSADEETRRLAFVRERALRDEVSLLSEAKREGRIEGRVEAKRETALDLIESRFGALPEWPIQQVNEADLVQIEAWIKGVLTADSLEALLGQH